MRKLLLMATLLPLGCTLEVPLKPSLANANQSAATPNTPADPPSRAPGAPPAVIDPVLDPKGEEPSVDVPPTWVPSTPDEPTATPVPLAPAVDQVVASAGVVAALRPEDGCVTLTEPQSGKVTAFETLCGPRAMAALESGEVLVLDGTGRQLWSVRPGGPAPALVAALEVAHTAVIVSPDDRLAVLATAPTTPAGMVAAELNPTDLAQRRLAIVDLGSGHVETYLTAFAIRDVDVTLTRVVVTMGHHDVYGFPEVVLQVFAADTLAYLGDVRFPNCADDLQITADGHLAVLAPRTCALHDVAIAQPELPDTWLDWDDVPPNGDPISFVDLEAVTHLANVPGFGPAAFSADGERVAGFTMRETLNVEWNLFPSEDFGIVVARADDFTFDLYEAGDVRPDFAFAPDGHLFVQGVRDGVPYLAVLDREAQALVALPGSPVSLRRHVTGPDGALYAASGGSLHRISAEGLEVVGSAHGDMVTRAGDLLVLTDRAAGTHAILNPTTLSQTLVQYSKP